MKRLICLIMLTIVILSMSACSSNVVAIEDYEWKMRAVMNENADPLQEDEFVIAVGEADDIHPDAKIVNITLTADNGTITVNDTTNNKTYSGTYKVQQKTPRGTDYEIIIDGIKGYATVAPTEYYNGTQIPTLPVSLDGYSLYFIPVEK